MKKPKPEFEFKNIGDAMSYGAVLAKCAGARGELPPLSLYKPKPKDIIAGGDPVRTPVDRVAARVVAPAPWQFQAPDIRPEANAEEPKQKPSTKPKTGEKKMNDSTSEPVAAAYEPVTGLPTTKGLKALARNPETGERVFQGEPLFNLDEVALRIIEKINADQSKLTPLARAAVDARGVLSDALRQVGGEMDLFKDNLKRWLEDVRGARMNFVSEANFMLGPLREIRQFFLDAAYEKEIARLREFVELCERLNALKESGFLDTVADTMIRLATQTERGT